MTLAAYIRAMPKVELHVHLQGATRPETLLRLAQRNGVELPARTLDDMRDWYTFRGWDHFGDVYDAICQCVQTADDIDIMLREFIAGQATQNIRYTEVTFTPPRWLPFDEQLDALGRARIWGAAEHGVVVNIVIDIPREVAPAEGELIAEWAISGMGRGVVAFGLGGPEAGNPPEKFATAFQRTQAAGLPSVPHAGEMAGPDSIWGALNTLNAARIGHGVRCLEDPALVDELRTRGTVLEVCPTSNVCLGLFPDFAAHPLPRLIDAGLTVTLNSDDPPMFNTTLTREYEQAAELFGFDADALDALVLNGVMAASLPTVERESLAFAFREEFTRLRTEYGLPSSV
jgi:adenosine deaminase